MSGKVKCAGCGRRYDYAYRPTPKGKMCRECFGRYHDERRRATFLRDTGGVEPKSCWKCGTQSKEGYKFIDSPVGGVIRAVCHNCFEDYVVPCFTCGKELLKTDRPAVHHLSDTDELQCSDCFKNTSSFHCGHCGTAFSAAAFEGEMQGRPICKGCWALIERRRDCIQDYHSHSRVWNRFGKAADGVYYGVELEAVMEEGYDEQYEDVARTVRKKYGKYQGKEFLFTEHDCSLEDDESGDTIGYETIFHPMSFGFAHQNAPLFDKILGTMRASHMLGYEANKRRISAGMHVTVTWSALNQDAKTKFLKLIYENPDLIARVSRRRGQDLQQYSSLRPPIDIEEMVEGKWPGFALRKHVAVNIKHLSRTDDTEDSDEVRLAEVRIFRSTLKTESFLMNIEFVAACVDFANDKRFGIRDTAAAKLLEFINAGQRDYPHIHAWMREKGLIR